MFKGENKKMKLKNATQKNPLLKYNMQAKNEPSPFHITTGFPNAANETPEVTDAHKTCFTFTKLCHTV